MGHINNLTDLSSHKTNNGKHQIPRLKFITPGPIGDIT